MLIDDEKIANLIDKWRHNALEYDAIVDDIQSDPLDRVENQILSRITRGYADDLEALIKDD